MKKFWSTLIMAVVVSAPVAFAQEDQGGGKGVEVKPEGRVQTQQPPRQNVLEPSYLARELNLSEEQRARIEGLWKQYRDRDEAIRRDTSITPEQRIQRFRQSREEYIRLVRSVLNEEQLKKFEALLESEANAPTTPTNMRFSPEQLNKIREITQRYNALRKQVQEDTSLDAQTRQRRLQELNKQMLDEIRSILTPEQRAQWDKAMKKDEKKGDQKEGEKKDNKQNPPSSGGGASGGS
jgi:Spy/CpxP family protein refolding chaperone